MKNIIVTLLLVLGTSLSVFSQKQSENSKNLANGKWRIESLDFGSEKIELSPNENNWMVFYEDGSYSLLVNGEEVFGSGTWSANEKGIQFDNENFKGKSIIKKLTNKEFMFSLTEGNSYCTVKLSK